MYILEIARKRVDLVKQGNKQNIIILDAVVNYGDKPCKLNIVLKLHNNTQSRFDLNYSLETESCIFSGTDLNSEFWLVTEKSTCNQYTYSLPNCFRMDMTSLIKSLKEDLIVAI